MCKGLVVTLINIHLTAARARVIAKQIRPSVTTVQSGVQKSADVKENANRLMLKIILR